MTKELEDALFAKYPEIFKEHTLPMTQTCMCWGIDCGDGWYNIIDQLCGCFMGRRSNVERNLATAEQFVDQPGTWWTPEKIAKLRKELVDSELPTASQVKEKFGTLRFYTNGADKITDALIDYAEAMSACTCELCGNPGTLYKTGWWQTLCMPCAVKTGRPVVVPDAEITFKENYNEF